VGAVLVDAENHLVGIGYNGAPHGQPHCSTHGCIVDESTGSCVRSIHAEINAILHASGPGITLYCTHAPCYRCAQVIIQVGVQRVVYAQPYRDGDERLDALDLLRDAHLDVVPYREEVPVPVVRHLGAE